MLDLGQKAPEFSLPDKDGKIHKPGDYLGKWLVVYFYPQDDTSGCTAEACSFRDSLPKFSEVNAEVLGISKDEGVSHKDFAEKHSLNFTLLSDPSKATMKAYGVFDQSAFAEVRRTSFLINPKGEIAKIYENVVPENHAEEILNDIKSLS